MMKSTYTCYRTGRFFRASIIALIVIITLSSFADLSAQSRQDTIYGTGIFSTKNAETTSFVPEASLWLTPITIAMETPDTTYNFTTDGSGVVQFTLPVFIDSITGIDDNFSSTSNVFPTAGSELNAIFEQKEHGKLSVYSISGQLVASRDFQSDNTYLNLSNLPAAVYVYNIATADGDMTSGKFIKQNVPAGGPSSRPAIMDNFKGTEEYEAVYKVKWEKEGYITDSTEITLTDGDNGFVKLYLTPEEGIPQDQDIKGVALDENNNWNPMQGVTAILYDETNDTTYTTITGNNGVFLFEDIPTGSTIYLSVGDVDNYYCLNNQKYVTPSVIEDENDTIADFFDVTMYAVRPEIQNLDVLIGQTNSGATTSVRKYWYSDEISSADRSTYNAWFSQYDAQTNDFTHVQTTNENESHIQIYDGANNTITNEIMNSTPLGNYFPTNEAQMYIHPADYGTFTHEVGQADGKSQCSGNGYLSSNPPPTGPNAEDIACGELDKMHWVDNVRVNERTYWDLNKISLTLQNKSPEYKNDLFYEQVRH